METYRGYSVEIVPDNDPGNPREWDNVGTMVCWHKRYTLGDEQPKRTPVEYKIDLACAIESDFRERTDNNETDDNEFAAILADNYIILPLFLYVHSGITMNTSGFSSKWDSGQVGFIYVKKGFEGMSDVKLEKNLKNEVDIYDTYIKGEVVGFVIKKNGEEVDSCWGFYSEEYATKEAKSFVDVAINQRENKQSNTRFVVVDVYNENEAEDCPLIARFQLNEVVRDEIIEAFKRVGKLGMSVGYPVQEVQINNIFDVKWMDEDDAEDGRYIVKDVRMHISKDDFRFDGYLDGAARIETQRIDKEKLIELFENSQ